MTVDVSELGATVLDVAPEVAEKLGFLQVDFGFLALDGLILGKTDHRDEAFEFVKSLRHAINWCGSIKLWAWSRRATMSRITR